MLLEQSFVALPVLGFLCYCFDISFVFQCSDTAVIYFDNVRVPAKNIIGQPGVFVYVKEMAMIVMNASHCGYVD